jgi:hypothetical protein
MQGSERNLPARASTREHTAAHQLYLGAAHREGGGCGGRQVSPAHIPATQREASAQTQTAHQVGEVC